MGLLGLLGYLMVMLGARVQGTALCAYVGLTGWILRSLLWFHEKLRDSGSRKCVS